jgi:hypothetical protein
MRRIEGLTASEFAFLALGLVLGVASGAALVTVFRSRPPTPREIKVTVTPDSVPRRRSSTLAEDAFTTQPPEPARGGPADRRSFDRDPAPGTRTLVRSGPQAPAGAGDPESGGSFRPVIAAMADGSASFLAPRYGSVRVRPGDGPSAVGIRVHDEVDWTLEAFRISARRTAEHQIREGRLTAAAILERPAGEAAPAREQGSVVSSGTNASHQTGTTMTGDPGQPGATDTSAHAAPAASPSSAPGASASGPDDGCGEARRIADERCTLATRAGEQAESAHEALRAAQRSYDDHLTRAERATVSADPRAMRVAKETAQQAFRQARAAGSDREAVEAAARDWLTEINRVNHAAREAAGRVQHELAAASGLIVTIERLTVEADAARISAESAEVACVAARQAVADCQEAAATGPAPSFPTAPSLGVAPGYRSVETDEETELEAAFAATGEGEPAILRLVRGDREELGRLVAQLAGDDPAERRRWQTAMADLIDAVVGRAIEAGALTFPVEHHFWGNFTLAQNRDIATALGSLGYRFDGLGGWMDDRQPSQRDLSLAVGYAGLDPMRLRHWPTEAETRELFTDVTVAADEFLAEAAGGLTLGELIDVLGRRADGLTELWNEWGRVRPLLLAGG